MKNWILVTGICLFMLHANAQEWRDADIPQNTSSDNRQIVPDRFHVTTIDFNALIAILIEAPLEFTDKAAHPLTVQLPAPDGTLQRFLIWNSPIMEAPLAKQFPQIQTFSCKGIDDPYASGRLDITEKGFHAMVFSPTGTWYIDPLLKNNIALYQSYYKRDFTTKKVFEELGVLKSSPSDGLKKQSQSTNAQSTAGTANRTNGTQLRTYRIAIATTGEYAAFHGGTVNGTLSAIITTLNRVTGVYRNELSINFNLIGTNTSIIYLNSSTDPYTNSDGGAMLTQNQTTLTNVIGAANYDIGHVFSTGGGGVAYLASVCNSSNKAGGVTGSSSPVGDPFDIDYVAHEMGHQFGGNHTFNGNTGSCSGGNRNASTAYEPGSGSTIMAYAGICSPQNTQSNSDPYFHTVNFDEIVTNITTGTTGSSGCALVTATGNNPPTATVNGTAYTIPFGTPFMLTGSGTDPDGDPLTYYWEQFDLGSSTAPNSPPTPGPRFRSYAPTISPSRIIPNYANLLAGTTPVGEILPTAAQTARFRFTVRDNNVNGGGVDYDQNYTTVTFAAVGPFAYNGALKFAPNGNATISWNVNGTNQSPVNCSQVNILLSDDGGATFAYTLATATANDGSETVLMPNITSTTCRVMIQAVGNIFFALSPNIRLEPIPAPTISAFSPTSAYQGDSVIITGADLDAVASVTLGGVSATFTITSPTRIAAFVGSGATGSVEVSNNTGTAALPGFTHLGANLGIYCIVGTGTDLVGTTSTSYQGTLGGYYGGVRTQTVYTASRLTTAGLKKGLIKQIGYNVATAVSGALTGYTIKMASTTSTSLSAFATTGFTTVYTTAAYNATTGWNMFQLTTPFYWDGTSSIIVETCFNNNNGGITGGNSQTYFTASATNTCRYYRADNISTVCTNTTSTAATSAANLRLFNLVAPNTVASGVTVSNIGKSSATVNWTSGDGNRRLVVARLASTTGVAPTQVNTYTANAQFGLGTTTGSGNFVVYNGTGNSVVVSGLAELSNYIFTVYEYNLIGSEAIYASGTSSTNVVTLPVTWNTLNASRKATEVSLTWTTASEYNNKAFTVEYSFDQQHWDPSGVVPSKGNANRITSYTYQHLLNPEEVSQDCYFRILQTDWDGKASYSKVLVTKAESIVMSSSALIQPNPAQDYIQVNHPYKGEVQIRFRSSDGILVKTLISDQSSISVEDLKNGLYFIEISQGENRITGSVSIQR